MSDWLATEIFLFGPKCFAGLIEAGSWTFITTLATLVWYKGVQELKGMVRRYIG